jgi:phosphopantothenate synthetase
MGILAAKGIVRSSRSDISDVLLGDNTFITLHQGISFDGSSLSIAKTPTLKTFAATKDPNGAFLNDNVYSVIVSFL